MRALLHTPEDKGEKARPRTSMGVPAKRTLQHSFCCLISVAGPPAPVQEASCFETFRAHGRLAGRSHPREAAPAVGAGCPGGFHSVAEGSCRRASDGRPANDVPGDRPHHRPDAKLRHQPTSMAPRSSASGTSISVGTSRSARALGYYRRTTPSVGYAIPVNNADGSDIAQNLRLRVVPLSAVGALHAVRPAQARAAKVRGGHRRLDVSATG